MAVGLVIGKFMPPTKGHQYLLDFAVKYCPRFRDDRDLGTYITMCVPKDVDKKFAEPIPVPFRAAALMKRYEHNAWPNIMRYDLPDEPTPGNEKQFQEQWIAALKNHHQRDKFDYVFGSEAYGKWLAEGLGAEFMPVNTGRRTVSISGSIVRESLALNWDYLMPEFRELIVPRVVVAGPESCGKTELCRSLASHFKTEWVPEWARYFLEANENRYPRNLDYMMYLEGQKASEDALAQQANKVLICDTDAATTVVCGKVLNDFDIPGGLNFARTCANKHSLILLCKDDVPFVADPLRYGGDHRQLPYDAYVDIYKKLGTPVVEISGDWNERFTKAVIAINRLLYSGIGFVEGAWK